jgi:alanine racemase
MMVDISACPDVKPGQEVSVIGGDGPSFSELADMCGTINYELLCAISARVPRVYVRNGKIIEVHSCISQ